MTFESDLPFPLFSFSPPSLFTLFLLKSNNRKLEVEERHFRGRTVEYATAPRKTLSATCFYSIMHFLKYKDTQTHRHCQNNSPLLSLLFLNNKDCPRVSFENQFVL